MKDTSIAVSWTGIKRTDDDLNHTQHVVRLYPAGPTWASLQIRGKSAITESGSGKAWSWWSSAHLDLDSATNLRDALNEWIGEHLEPPEGDISRYSPQLQAFIRRQKGR